MISQLVNKRTGILAVAISHIAHLRNKYEHVFSLLVCHVLIALIFLQNKYKIMLFLPPKEQNFRALGAPSPSCLRRLAPRPP